MKACRRVAIAAVALVMAALCPLVAAGELKVNGGQFELAGKVPLRAIGVNYFDAVNRILNNPADQSSVKGMEVLARHEIPFARIMFGGFWPNEIRLYDTDRARYFQALDRVVQAAEANNIGIVASLAWNHASIPDLVGESVSAWGMADSRTRSYFRSYISTVVGRYKGSKAIWMWEFGNEMALYVDLPNSKQWRPRTDPSKGTPNSRSDADDLKAADQAAALADFLKTVRAVDPSTPLSTGNAIPRPFAFHNSLDGSWRKDTREQFCSMLARDNPPGFDVVSVHLYPSNRDYFGREGHDPKDLVDQVGRCASAMRKPAFIGEFGAADDDRTLGPSRTPREAFLAILSSFEDSTVGLAAAWVFDFKFQDSSFNITPDNARAYQLTAIRDVNRRLREARR